MHTATNWHVNKDVFVVVVHVCADSSDVTSNNSTTQFSQPDLSKNSKCISVLGGHLPKTVQDHSDTVHAI